MTRKDYELIAEAIREARSKVLKSSNTDLMSEYRTGCNDALYELSLILSGRFFDDNPRFDDNRWMIATETLHN